MAVRGVKKGSFRQTSFVGKLLCLKVDEAIMLDDYGGEKGPTRIERDLHCQLHRSEALEGKDFTSIRVRWIDGDRLRLASRITRTK